MQIQEWDEGQIHEEFQACENFGELVRQIESRYERQGQLICEVSVNGMVCSEEDENRFAMTPLDQIKTLSIKTQDLDELISDIIIAAKDKIGVLHDALIKTSEWLQAGNVQEAQNIFLNTLDGVDWLVEVLLNLRNAASGRQVPDDMIEDWQAGEQQLTDVVREVLESFEKRDFALFADLLEYELSTALTNWHGLLDKANQEKAWIGDKKERLSKNQDSMGG